MDENRLKKLFAKVGGDTLLECLSAECADFATVIYARNHERWAVGYVLEKLPSGGCRLLSLDPDLRVHRVKSGARIVYVPAELHSKLVRQYREFQEAAKNVAAGNVLVGQGAGRPESAPSRPRKSNAVGRSPGPAQKGRRTQTA